MPIAFINSFTAPLDYRADFNKALANSPWKVFVWDDNPSDDDTFIDYLSQNVSLTILSFDIDRSGPPELVTTSAIPDVPVERTPLAVGDIWFAAAPGAHFAGMNDDRWLAPGRVDLTGRWWSDEYGRPFDLEDLAAPSE
jgi:hypothetical protein